MMYDELIFWGFIVCCASALTLIYTLVHFCFASTFRFAFKKKTSPEPIQSVLNDPKNLDDLQIPTVQSDEFSPSDLFHESSINKIQKGTHELEREKVTFEKAYDSLKNLPEHLREPYLKHYALHPHLVLSLIHI